jgi:hypothetical protein|tara:strand:- start:9734 stop:10249 length:516 start_codon:yes stop_codon:yes gene_type:complete
MKKILLIVMFCIYSLHANTIQVFNSVVGESQFNDNSKFEKIFIGDLLELAKFRKSSEWDICSKPCENNLNDITIPVLSGKAKGTYLEALIPSNSSGGLVGWATSAVLNVSALTYKKIKDEVSKDYIYYGLLETKDSSNNSIYVYSTIVSNFEITKEEIYTEIVNKLLKAKK